MMRAWFVTLDATLTHNQMDGDRSEEDNDPLTDDPVSAISIPRHSGNLRASHLKPSSVSRVKHQLASSLLSDSDGVDSPTYDGDVESSATIGAAAPPRALHHHHHHHTSSTSTLGHPIIPSSITPITEPANPIQSMRATTESNHPVFISSPVNTLVAPTHVPEEPAVAAASQAAFNPAALSAEDIQNFVRKAIDGEPWRQYIINPPPTDRPVRVYADGLFPLLLPTSSVLITSHLTGVYDLFHFG